MRLTESSLFDGQRIAEVSTYYSDVNLLAPPKDWIIRLQVGLNIISEQQIALA